MSIARSVAPFAGLTAPLWAQSVALPYNTQYSIVDLGTPPGVPPNNGGLVVMAGDPNYLLIGGAANQATGAIYQIRLVRNDSNHIIGFSGTATRYANGPNNDGGLAYGPGNVLFFTRYPVHELGQIKPGSTVVDRSVPLGPLGYSSSVGACTFVPSGFPQAGRLKLASYNGGRFHDATVSPDGNGTFNVSAATAGVSIGGGPEGIAYIPPGSPLFTDYTSLLVCEYGSGAVVVYDVNANADPIVTTRRLFITGLSGAEGAAIDPATGDFLFSTYRGSNRVLVVRGFGSPCASFLNYGTGLAGSAAWSRACSAAAARPAT